MPCSSLSLFPLKVIKALILSCHSRQSFILEAQRCEENDLQAVNEVLRHLRDVETDTSRIKSAPPYDSTCSLPLLKTMLFTFLSSYSIQAETSVKESLEMNCKNNLPVNAHAVGERGNQSVSGRSSLMINEDETETVLP